MDDFYSLKGNNNNHRLMAIIQVNLRYDCAFINYINTKNCSLSIMLTAMDQKPQRWYYASSHHLDVSVMLSNIT